MNILIFSREPIPAVTAALIAAGHHVHLASARPTAHGPAWDDAPAVAALAAQADLAVYRLDAGADAPPQLRAWLVRLPGVLWPSGENGIELARRFGHQSLGILAPAGATTDDVGALLPFCPGPVLQAAVGQEGAALLQLGQAVQGLAPVRAAADAMAAILRGWGADEDLIRTGGLAAGFDLFRA